MFAAVIAYQFSPSLLVVLPFVLEYVYITECTYKYIYVLCSMYYHLSKLNFNSSGKKFEEPVVTRRQGYIPNEAPISVKNYLPTPQ